MNTRRKPQEDIEGYFRAARDIALRNVLPGRGSDELVTKAQNKKEAEDLRKWADANDSLSNQDEFSTLWRERNRSLAGSEHQVVIDEDRVVVTKRKIVWPHETYLGYFNRIEIHNIIAPNAPYILLGFSEVPAPNGQTYFMPVVEQPFIQGRAATPEEIDAYMHNLGFEGTGGWYENEALRVFDAGGHNATRIKGGDIVLIDTKIETKDMDINTGEPVGEDERIIKDKMKAWFHENQPGTHPIERPQDIMASQRSSCKGEYGINMEYLIKSSGTEADILSRLPRMSHTQMLDQAFKQMLGS